MVKRNSESCTISKFSKDVLNWALMLCRHWGKNRDNQNNKLWEDAERKIIEVVLIHYLDIKKYLNTQNIFARILENYHRDEDYLEEEFIENEISRWRKRLTKTFPIKIFKQISDGNSVPNSVWDKILSRLYTYSKFPDDNDLWGYLFQEFRSHELICKETRLSIRKTSYTRRADGFFFTPPNIVKYMLETTLQDYLDKIEKFHGLQSLEAISNLRILDPSCGTGIFLSEVFRILSRFYQKINRKRMSERGKELAEKNNLDLFSQEQFTSEIPEPIIHYHEKIIHDHIFGIDTDMRTIELCELDIFLNAIEEGLDVNRLSGLSSLSTNLRVGNSLYPIEDNNHINDFCRENKTNIFELEKIQDSPDKKEKYTKLKNDFYEKYFEKYPHRFDEGDKASPFCWIIEFPQLFHNELLESNEETGFSKGFDFIVGNPPWSSLFFSKFSKQKEPVWAEYFQNSLPFLGNQKRISSSMVFLARGINLLNPKGQLAFVINQEFLTVQAYRKIREFVLENTLIERIVEHVDFRGVNINASILFLKKPEKLPIPSEKLDWYKNESTFLKRTSQEIFKKNFNNNFAVSLWENILKPANVKTVSLETIADVSTGMCITREDFCSDTPIDEHWHPGLFGSNVSRYSLIWPSEEQMTTGKGRKPYLCYDNTLLEKVNKRLADEGSKTVKVLGSSKRFENPKILIRQTPTFPRIEGVLDKEKYYVEQSLHIITAESEDLLYALLGILNSKLLSLFARENRFILFQGMKTPQIRVTALKALPIPETLESDKSLWNELSNKTKERQELGNKILSIRKIFDQEWKKGGFKLHHLRFYFLEPLFHMGKIKFTENWPQGVSGNSLEIDFNENSINILLVDGSSKTIVLNIERTHTDPDNFIYWALDRAVTSINDSKHSNSKYWRDCVHHLLVPVTVIDPNTDLTAPYIELYNKISRQIEIPDPSFIIKNIDELEAQINTLVIKLYKLDAEEIKLLEEYWEIYKWKK